MTKATGLGIEKLSIEYQRAATRLSELIKSYNAWLNSLPGKVRFSCAIGKNIQIAVDNCRKCGWEVYCKTALDDGTFDPESEFKPMVESTMETRLQVVALLPEITNAIYNEFQKQIINVSAAADNLSALLQLLDASRVK